LCAPFLAKNDVNYQAGSCATRCVSAIFTVNALAHGTFTRFCRGQTGSPFRPPPTIASSSTTGAGSCAFGASYALTGDKKTVVKATYGRFNFALRASDSRTIRNFNKNDYSATLDLWNDVNGNRLFDYPAEVGAFVQTEGASSTVFNPNIAQPTAMRSPPSQREISAGSRRNRLRLQARSQQFNWSPRRLRHHIPSRCRSRRDGVPARRTMAGNHLLRPRSGISRNVREVDAINFSDFTDRYNNLEVGLDKRMSNNWQVRRRISRRRRTSGRWFQSDDWCDPVHTERAVVPEKPDVETTFRVSGNYRAPYNIVVKRLRVSERRAAQRNALPVNLKQLSTVTLRMEPIGSVKLLGELLNLRASKQFVYGKQRVSVDADLYNANAMMRPP
jgi:hypothetical protein